MKKPSANLLGNEVVIDDGGEVDTSKQAHQDESLDNQQTIEISVITKNI